ncbi:MAG TPA: T9SS type A sorting domain-containing protein [bacterium (Candidatus Stahlbacteria)]|nr:T9SS type A sorting domain-containing protein [Candidatus Stahlbacteria bacterium]
MFGCNYLGDGEPYTTGNVQSVSGQGGSIASGLNFNYLYKTIADNYVDYIGSNGGTIFFKSQDNLGRAVNYGGSNNNYRSIHSAFIFGALRNGANTKNELMAIYLDYLLAGPKIEEQMAKVKNLSLNVYPNPFRTQATISLSLKKASTVRIRVYNVAGQMVREVLNKQLTAGIHQLCLNLTGLRGGIYLLRGVVGEKAVKRSLVLTD